ncbi:MAG: hypothetical protein KDG89_18555, partial [Geminicoccaceae bacterium]|nr:hypothetical protein [Geminicoccaceae bacterium]
IARGAADANRRLFVTTVPDLDRTPGHGGEGLTGEVTAWNSAMRGYANGHANVIAVDLHTVFERLFADPARFGFSDVTSIAPSRAEITD